MNQASSGGYQAVTAAPPTPMSDIESGFIEMSKLSTYALQQLHRLSLRLQPVLEPIPDAPLPADLPGQAQSRFYVPAAIGLQVDALNRINACLDGFLMRLKV